VTDDDWEVLLERIAYGRCTPFLGAGACVPALPLGGELAEEWADEFGYPMDDRRDLARVAQFMAVKRKDRMFPKERIQARLENLPAPDFTREDEPHAVLAELPLPVYMTTNYDGFMTEALRHNTRNPAQEICHWNGNPRVRAAQGVLAAMKFIPTPQDPVVFHLHGRLGIPESMVLTEDDYLDFLVATSRKKSLLPHQMEAAIAGSSLLFIGYRLADWSFRVLHRGLVTNAEQSLQRQSVAVQIAPSPDPDTPEGRREAEAVREFLERYFDQLDVLVFWGDANSFATELRRRWRDFRRADG
jgi:hypothetical protein